MKRTIAVLTILLLIVLGTQNYFLKQTKQRLIEVNEQLSIIILEPATPRKVYVLGCTTPSGAILVYSNGNSYLTQGKAKLMKLERKLPEDLPVEFYQPPECRSKGT